MAWWMREAHGKIPDKSKLMKSSLLLLYQFVKIIHVKVSIEYKMIQELHVFSGLYTIFNYIQFVSVFLSEYM